MSLNSTLARLTSTLNNGQKARKLEITLCNNKKISEVLSILKTEGYIRDFFFEDNQKIRVLLKYYKDKPSISKIEMISKNNRNNIISFKQLQLSHRLLKQQNQGLGTFILSTSQGLLTEYDCINRNIGGCIILRIT